MEHGGPDESDWHAAQSSIQTLDFVNVFKSTSETHCKGNNDDSEEVLAPLSLPGFAPSLEDVTLENSVSGVDVERVSDAQIEDLENSNYLHRPVWRKQVHDYLRIRKLTYSL